MNILNTAISRSVSLLPRGLVSRVASSYIAGESLEDALRETENLNRSGAAATIDLLGEDPHSLDRVDETLEAYETTLESIATRGLKANVSIKPSAFGLRIDPEYCLPRVRQLLARAERFGNTVRIDMEDASLTADTLALYQDLRRFGQDNVGVVLQARLRRTPRDARNLIRAGASVRLCKGIYLESDVTAHSDPEIVRRCFKAMLEQLVAGGNPVAIATHDEALVRHALDLVRDRRVPKTHYEFQMLLGVLPGLRNRIITEGHPMRVYVPYGRDWYAYSQRRLRENPQVAGHVMRAMLRPESPEEQFKTNQKGISGL